MKSPKPILKSIEYIPKDEAIPNIESATEYVLAVENGETFFLKWYGSGWVIKFRESFFCKNKTFQHKDDIPGFELSHLPVSDYKSPLIEKLLTDWQYVYATKEEAIEFYRTKDFPKLKVTKEFLMEVLDILFENGVDDTDDENEYRSAFYYNYLEDFVGDDEWICKTEQGIELIYSIEQNRVFADPYISTIVVFNINTMLEKLDQKFKKS